MAQKFSRNDADEDKFIAVWEAMLEQTFVDLVEYFDNVDKKFYDLLSEPSEDEEDMLDLAFGLTPTSRLGCQIVMTKELDGLTLVVPDETRNVSMN